MSAKDSHKVSMEEYAPIEEGMFRHLLWSQENLSLGATARWQYRWVKPDDLLSTLWDQSGQPVYFLMREEFAGVCQKFHLPRHNAIAFWHYLLEHKDEMSKENPSLLYCLVCEGACNFGDYFMDVFVRNTPQDMVWPEDVVDIDFRRRTEEYILREDVVSPERTASTTGFGQFTERWNQQLKAAQHCQAWMERYRVLNICEMKTRDFHGDDRTIHALAHILRQYIQMLNESPNSKQPKFEEKWKELHQNVSAKRLCETSDLFCTLERIAGLLESMPDIALIAPIYVLALFREQLSKLYNGKIECISKLSAKQILHAPGAKFYKDTESAYGTPKNTYFRRDAQLVTYQILCDYFQHNSNCLCQPYDKELCNYMIQTVLPLIGECYFDISHEDVCSIVTEGKYICLGGAKQKSSWVHPLLQEIDTRLEKSLRLIPDKIPHIAAADSMGFSPTQWMTEGEALARKSPDFVDRYLDILVLADGGIGNPKLSYSTRKAFADLLDQSIANSTNPIIQGLREATDDLPPENLYALETGVHSACASTLLQRYRTEILLFMYQYFQSADFCVGVPIPISWYELIVNGELKPDPELNILFRDNSAAHKPCSPE